MNKDKKITYSVIFTLCFFLWYIQNRFFALAEYYAPKNIFKGINKAMDNIEYIFFELKPTTNITANIFSLLIPLFIFYIVTTFSKKKNYKKNIEYGSARWGRKEDIKNFENKNFKKNVILSKTENLTMTKASAPKYELNKNILVVGGSGSGKTRGFLKPNIMQRHSSYVVTDPKGTVLNEVGNLLLKPDVTMLSSGKYKATKVDEKLKLVKEPYVIKVFNTVNFDKSNCYNPFSYIKSEEDILIFVEALISNTTGKNATKGENGDFFEKAERNLYVALISFIKSFLVEEEQHIGTMIDMIDNSQVLENDETYESDTDRLFKYIEFGNPELGIKPDPLHFCVKQYKKFKQGAGKTLKSILISCGTRLAPFDIKKLRELMSKDELELDKIGDRKTALFIITSDTTPTFNFISAILYSQLFNLLCTKADDEYGGRLPMFVRFLLDEFANNGQIPNFERLIVTIRSRGLSASIFLQNDAQLKTLYKEASATIVGNCDSEVFLGGKEKETAETISKMLGKETIDITNTSKSYGNQKSLSRQEQKLGRELMTPDEIRKMPGDECIVQIRGLPPFKSKKYDITQHKDYKYLWDNGNIKSKKYFDYSKYIKKQREKENNNISIIKKVSNEEFQKPINL